MNAVDTNVLIYAADSDAGVKGATAVALLDRLATEDTILPWQVLCEFCNFVGKSRAGSKAGEEAFEYVRVIRERFPLVLPTATVADKAIQI